MLTKNSAWTWAMVAVACVGLFAGSARGEDGLWMTDYAAAKAKAKAEKKLLLLDFTGSDWCGWCIKLHEEVFDLPTFKTEAPKKFVLVELDFPQKKELPAALKAQNDKLQEEFKVTGFPTIYITDADGAPLAKTGYQDGGAVKYMASLDGLVTAHEKLQTMMPKLAAATGADRAKLMDEILAAQETLGNPNPDAAKWEEEILTLDGENKAGLKTKYTVKKMVAEALTETGRGKFDEAKAIVTKALALEGLSAQQKQDLYAAQAEASFRSKDFAGVVDSLTKARDAAPASNKADRLDGAIKRLKPIAEAQASLVKLKADLDAAKPADRVKVLDQLVTAQETFSKASPSREAQADVQKWSQEILTLDPDNKAGLKTKYESKALIMEASKKMWLKDFAGAEEAVKKALALPGLTEEQKEPIVKLQKNIETMKAKAPAAGALK